MRRFELMLDISAEKYLHYYKGHITKVIARTTTGAVVQFPALLLRDVVSHDGVHGRFELTCDDQMKGAKIRRLGQGQFPG